MMHITESELLDALRASLERVAPEDDGAHTVLEMAELTGWHIKKVRVAIRTMMTAGELELVQTYRTNICGQVRPTHAWRTVAPPASN